MKKYLKKLRTCLCLLLVVTLFIQLLPAEALAATGQEATSQNTVTQEAIENMEESSTYGRVGVSQKSTALHPAVVLM